MILTINEINNIFNNEREVLKIIKNNFYFDMDIVNRDKLYYTISMQHKTTGIFVLIDTDIYLMTLKKQKFLTKNYIMKLSELIKLVHDHSLKNKYNIEEIWINYKGLIFLETDDYGIIKCSSINFSEYLVKQQTLEK